jgi:hypothetical protein
MEEVTPEIVVSWLTPIQVERLRLQFRAPDGGLLDPDEFSAEVLNPRNWEDDTLPEEEDDPEAERRFDCVPFDGQLRCYLNPDNTLNYFAAE